MVHATSMRKRFQSRTRHSSSIINCDLSLSVTNTIVIKSPFPCFPKSILIYLTEHLPDIIKKRSTLPVYVISIGHFNGKLQVRYGKEKGKGSLLTPKEDTTTLCGSLFENPKGQLEGSITCWKPGVGQYLFLIGESTSDPCRMKICEISV